MSTGGLVVVSFKEYLTFELNLEMSKLAVCRGTVGAGDGNTTLNSHQGDWLASSMQLMLN